MAKLFLHHPVADFDKWRPVYDGDSPRRDAARLQFKAERAEAVEGLGGTSVVDHVAHGGGNMVAVSADVADVDAMNPTLAAPSVELAAVMEEHGVLPPLVAYVER